MQETSPASWFKSIALSFESLQTVGAALFASYTAFQGTLAPIAEFLGMDKDGALRAAQTASLSLLALVLWFVFRSYRRFAKASRLEKPDRFSLSATTPESLIGRTEDLRSLHDTIVKNRVVLLDGESGCGKSALVAAGLVPRLMSGTGPLPILICDWGDDWVRGPLATALGALFEALSPEQRVKLAWAHAPDLAADASKLAAELDMHLNGVAEKLGRRPLLITDQFDDYQALHRERFIDADGNWLKPESLKAVNPFWALICAKLQTDALHLLVVTRADTASGLSCVSFLDSARTAERSLPRVDSEFLRPLLENIAPVDATPVVVSRPDQGWQDLRDRLETDLRQQGAILMQQVRIVLLGLRQLPMLTVAAYRRAGGLRGTESLVVARAIRLSGNAAGGGEDKHNLARRVLGALVLPGGVNQPAKARRVSFAALSQLVGQEATARVILQTLQAEDVVRPVEGVGGGAAWQLDHDYLAHAVLAEARQADRWGIALRESLERYHQAGDVSFRRWRALLSNSLQARLAWEWLRGRLRYGEAAGFALLSLLKPALAVLLVVTASAAVYVWNEDRLLSVEALKIYERFGGGASEDAAVLEAWRATGPIRDRLYVRVQEDEGRLERATRSAWPQSHGGLEMGSLLQSAGMLRERLGRETEFRIEAQLVNAYATLATRLTDQVAIQQAAVALRERLTRKRFGGEFGLKFESDLAEAYTTVATLLTDSTAIQREVAVLHERLVRETDPNVESNVAYAYASVASLLSDPTAIQKAAAVLRERIVSKRLVRGFRYNSELDPGKTYESVATKLADPAAIQAEAGLLLERLARETDSEVKSEIANAYATVAAMLTEPAAIQQAAAVLRELLVRENMAYFAVRNAHAYDAVVAKLTDPAAIQMEASTLREYLIRETDSDIALNFVIAYAAVAARSTDETTLQDAAAVLRERLMRMTDILAATSYSGAYASVAVRLTDHVAIQKEAVALRERLVHEADYRMVSILADTYAMVAAKLTDHVAIQKEAVALRERLVRETDSRMTSSLANAYAAVAEILADPTVIHQEATVLHKHLVHLVRGIGPGIECDLAFAYATVTAKLTDPAALLLATDELHERLVRETEYESVSRLAQAYAIVAARQTDPAALQQAAAALRERLGIEYEFRSEVRLPELYTRVESGLPEAYTKVVAKLTELSALKQEAAALRKRLVRESNANIASTLAKTYATVARRIIEDSVDRADRAETASQVREVLILAGHPFIRSARSLLAALEPTSGKSFGSHVGAAVEWWVKEFKGDPATLRPPPGGPS